MIYIWHVSFICVSWYLSIWMKRVAVCCSVLQCVAVYCSVLQCVAVYCSVVQCVAMCCSVSQCVAVHRYELQRVALCCSASPYVVMCCKALQCIAVCFSALQCIAVYFSVFQCVICVWWDMTNTEISRHHVIDRQATNSHTATHCNTLQTRVNTLQRGTHPTSVLSHEDTTHAYVWLWFIRDMTNSYMNRETCQILWFPGNRRWQSTIYRPLQSIIFIFLKYTRIILTYMHI